MIRFLTWKNLSIKEKLILISFITTGSALLLVGIIFVTGEILNVRQSSVAYLSGLTRTVSQAGAHALKSGDRQELQRVFESLTTKLDITCAVLYDDRGNELKKFDRGSACPALRHPLPYGETYRFGLTSMDMTQEIVYGGSRLGTIHMRADLSGSYSKVINYMTTLIVIMGCSFLLGYILFSNLQNTVTRHIYELTSLMRIVSQEKNYSVRVETVTKDEVGVLAQGFNEMLNNIRARDEELAKYRQGLEELVEQRTRELTLANEQLQRELEERLRMEKALQESEHRYRTIFETSGNANAVLEEDMTVSVVNSAFEKLAGFRRDEIENKKVFSEFVSSEDLERIKGYHHARRENPETVPGEYECRLLHRDGTSRDVYVSASIIPGTKRSILSILDVTELRKLQAQLLQSQKMEAIGQLAGGVAHDFNNILTIIMGYGSILLMNTDKDSTIKSYAESILASAERASNLTQSLLAFSRRQSLSPKNIELNGVIKNVEKLLRRLIGEDIELKTRLYKTPVPVFADPGQIEQVLINLAANARDAMPRGGSLTIETGIVSGNDESVRGVLAHKQGDYARISVADTGMGMSTEIAQRIFEPFFTTKEEGKGTGLGLSIVHGVITQHNGHIEVHSDPGRGTVFTMYLPLVEYHRERTRAPVVHHSQGGEETVLLAEDNEPVRILVRNILSEYGYTVLESADGEGALETFKTYNEPIHLLLLDVILPKINGRTVYDEIRKTKPDIKVLFMSGYTSDVVRKHGISETYSNFLQKPIMPHTLLAKVRHVLDGVQ